jgi:drug/metabolite transporter (DMT)-like permease
MKHLQSEKQKGIFALVLLAAIFACMGIFARFLSTHLLLFQQVYFRIFTAFFIGLIFFRKSIRLKNVKKISKKEWVLLIARAAAQYLFGIVLFTKAILLAKYANISFIGAIPFTAILGIFILKESVHWKKIGLLLIAIVGVYIIGAKELLDITSWGRGELLMLVSSIAVSFGYIARRWHSNLLNNQEITVLVLGIAFIMVIIVSLFAGEYTFPPTAWNIDVLMVALIAGLFNVANLFLINYGFAHVETVTASNILTLESIFGILIGVSIYAELPTGKEIIGGLLILSSVIWMNCLKPEHEVS